MGKKILCVTRGIEADGIGFEHQVASRSLDARALEDLIIVVVRHQVGFGQARVCEMERITFFLVFVQSLRVVVGE